MPVEPEDPRTEDEEQHEEGGPIKSFLDHLEDLRWVLIKSGSTAMVAMLICLLAGDRVVQILKRPLERAQISYPKEDQVVTLNFGKKQLGVFLISPEQRATFAFGTNRFVGLQIEPVTIGNDQVLRLRMDTNSTIESAQRLPIQLINLSPAGAFVVATKGAFYAGLVLAAPFIFYFVAQFVFPALKWKERKYLYRGMAFGGGLFGAGVFFCYYYLMPVALTASVQYSQWLGFTASEWRAEDYIGFVCKFMLGMGLGFEMPVVILVLVKIGILNYQMLSKARLYMVVINFFLGAILTTPEIVTQVLMAVPLQILYEISVWIAWYWERKERKRAEAE